MGQDIDPYDLLTVLIPSELTSLRGRFSQSLVHNGKGIG